MFGIIFGLSQWVILRDRIPGIFSWVLFTALSAFIAALLGKIMYSYGITLGFFGRVMFGLIVGSAQYLSLRWKFVRAGWWIITTCGSWVIAQAIITISNSYVQLLSGIVFGTITGFVLIWLVQYPLPDKKNGITPACVQQERMVANSPWKPQVRLFRL
jgi:hypothetical protein